MLSAPCRNCPDRCIEPNCHITCEKYKEFLTEAKVIQEKEKRAREDYNQLKLRKHRR